MSRHTVLSKWNPEAKPLEFVKVSGNAWADDYEDDYSLWRHPTAVDAEGPIWLYIKMTELPRDCRGPHSHKWEAELIAVSPFFASDASIASSIRGSGGWAESGWKDLADDKKELMVSQLLIEHGTKYTVLNKTSSRAKGPFRGCAIEASAVGGLWGFFADSQANAWGNSGWDFLKGEIGPGRLEIEMSEFDIKVIDWLNTYYPERKEYHAE